MPGTFVERDRDAPSSASSYVCFRWCCRTCNHQAPDAKAWSVVDEPLDSVAVRAGAYYGEAKADCLIGNHVAPQISSKGRNLLTPEEAHWHHLSFM